MKWVLLLLLPVMMLAELTTSERDRVNYYEDLYEHDWDKFLGDSEKSRVLRFMSRANTLGLAWTAGGALMVETRAHTDRLGINYRKGKVNSLDCGVFGSNTYYYLRYEGIEKPTLMQQIEACTKLNQEEDESYKHFVTTYTTGMRFTSIQKLKGTKEYYRRLWSYYNTGNPYRYKGGYYLRMIAAVNVLQRKISKKDIISTGS